VPLIMRGPQVPAATIVDTPVSLVDLFPTVLDAVGCPKSAEDDGLPGRSLWRIADGESPDRAVLSEYHAVGSISGSYMIRQGRWKFVYHVGHRPELFDLTADPGEVNDLAADPDHATVVRDCENALRRMLDPEAVNGRAFADQSARIAAHGGDEAIRQRGDFGYTPAPGEQARFA
jgi:choline-sulfatase